MVSSARQAIACVLFVLGIAVWIQAQTTTQKVASGSISGKVTIKGKPAVGVTVLAKDSHDNRFPISRRDRVRTDQAGNYRITNLPAGTYEISAITPALVPANQSDSIVVSEGEEVADVNISLVPGGVITGEITDAEGEAVIGELVRITPVDQQLPSGFRNTLLSRLMQNTTDDRGIYRAFGLPPGKYKVSVGSSVPGMQNSREYYKETFYPSVTDAAKATIIEVTEGSVTNDVNIVLDRPVGTFRVAGRVVDGETGRAIPNIRYGVGRITKDQYGTGSSSSVSGEVTNANGEFRLENVTPGTYSIFTAPSEESDVPAASVTFDVVDHDVTNLLITTTKGSSLSGVVVLDGNEKAPTMLGGSRICAVVQSREATSFNSPSSPVGQDGSFRIDGVRSGFAGLWLCHTNDRRKEFEIVRVERNGITQSQTIDVKEGEHVAGLRVIVKYRNITGAIRGQVKVENGELPPISQLSLSLWPLEENLEPKRSHSIPSPQLDARGRFFAEGLPAGTYRLSVYVLVPGPTSGRTRIAEEKQVTVTDDTVTEVTLIIKP